MNELLKYRVLDRLSGTDWIKKSQLTQSPLRHIKARDREALLYILIEQGLIEEVKSRLVGGPGAPYIEYRITLEGIQEHCRMAQKYQDGVSRTPTHRVVAV